VRLVVEIQAVGNQFFELDLGRAFKGTSAGTSAFTAIAAIGTVATVFSTTMLAARTSTTTTWSIATTRTIAPFATLFLGRARGTILTRGP
jgi:hypothetical protein